jgi:pullulanase/glycogen debranching enzyme
MFLDGSGADDPDDDFYIAFNADREPVEFTIPRELGRHWHVVLYTAGVPPSPVASSGGLTYNVEGHALLAAACRRTSPPAGSTQD